MLKKVYAKSPVFVQNIMISIENMFVLYKKYNYLPFIRPMKKIFAEVDQITINYEKEELEKRLEKFYSYTSKHTPYYKNTVSLSAPLSNNPILKKDILRKNIQDFYSDEITQKNCRTLFTSGSSGSPMEIKVAVKDLQFRYRIILKTMIDFGYKYDDVVGRITGHDIADENNIYRQDFINNQFFLSAFHISDETIDKYYDVIVENNIQALDGYPSAIYTLAKLFEQNNLKIDTIKIVYTTAEKLHRYQKEKIEKVFNCKVFDYYGSNEQSVYIYTCKNGHLHLSNKTGILEVLDDNYHPVANGQVGKMIITSFTSHFMPLIRYDIGDQCIVSKNQNCSCGNKGVIIDEIIGRDEDIFKTIDGVYITRFSVVLKYLPSQIIESQLILSNNKISASLLYISKDVIDDILFKDYEKALISKIGTKYKIEKIKVSKIEKSSKGKTRAVIIEN